MWLECQMTGLPQMMLFGCLQGQGHHGRSVESCNLYVREPGCPGIVSYLRKCQDRPANLADCHRKVVAMHLILWIGNACNKVIKYSCLKKICCWRPVVPVRSFDTIIVCKPEFPERPSISNPHLLNLSGHWSGNRWVPKRPKDTHSYVPFSDNCRESFWKFGLFCKRPLLNADALSPL